MLSTQTKSPTSSKTQVAIGTGILLLAAGAAAFAIFGLPQDKLYSSLSVVCQDGSKMIGDQYIETVYRTATATPQAGPGRPCFTSKEAQNIAATFCLGARNAITGKTGINTFSVSGRCEQTPQKSNYGYGYGYGYPASKK